MLWTLNFFVFCNNYLGRLRQYPSCHINRLASMLKITYLITNSLGLFYTCLLIFVRNDTNSALSHINVSSYEDFEEAGCIFLKVSVF